MSALQEKELAKPVPLTTGADGVIRVSGTRVTLDTVVAAFDEGATAEENAQQYPTLALAALADIYVVLGYYLRQRKTVAAYLRKRRRISAAVREKNKKCFPPNNVRSRLLAGRILKL